MGAWRLPRIEWLDSVCIETKKAMKCFSALALLIVAASATAGPYTRVWLNSPPNPVGSGARALGQGNAFIAVADDATAANWNPGGLSQLWKPELSLALEGYSRQIDWSATGHPEADGGDDLRLKDLNYASIVVPLPCERNAVLSLSYLKQYRFDAEMDFSFHTPAFVTVDDTTSLEQ